ncbi:DUF1365 domain-containing protein [Methylocystis sp. ATCC 49242]|uniref:DUF1365 domain-containing protein n=1 Tax=Methylocystis sp. ATCC 49242 TaxID=622637 RepID=UPI0001F878AC|nr:DUF1365 family protein [Methylocystis sp. ATCC 49242]
MTMKSALYVGSVAHRRIRPKSHRLRYRVFALLLDLDELPALDRKLRLFSLGRFNLFGFRPQDHLFARSGDLRGEVEALLRDAGLDAKGGAIRLLTMPRILGYGFNPLSIFFCYRVDGALQAILYEVHNTFGQRHCYLFPVGTDDRTLRHACAKQFYVSPFMAMDMTYSFRIKPPDEAYAVSISVADKDGDMLFATQHLSREALDDRALMRVFLSHPLLTLKVIAGIHYEALLIWLKGVALHVRPPPPGHAVTVANKNREKESVSCQI